MARRDAYLDALDARYRYARQLERIERDLADEQQRFQAAQSYASQARSELNQLDAQLSAVQDQEGLASELLKMVNRDTIAASRSVATAQAARGAAQRTVRLAHGPFGGVTRHAPKTLQQRLIHSLRGGRRRRRSKASSRE